MYESAVQFDLTVNPNHDPSACHGPLSTTSHERDNILFNRKYCRFLDAMAFSSCTAQKPSRMVFRQPHKMMPTARTQASFSYWSSTYASGEYDVFRPSDIWREIVTCNAYVTTRTDCLASLIAHLPTKGSIFLFLFSLRSICCRRWVQILTYLIYMYRNPHS